MIAPIEQDTEAALYRLCGLTLSCDVALPELAQVMALEPQEAIDLHVRLSGRDRKPPLPVYWFNTCSLSSGEPWLSAGRIEAGYVLRFHDLADFSVDRRRRTITCFPKADTTAVTLRHLLLDQVMPLVLRLYGRHALHATAVQTPMGVCAFIGPAGAGKSTLAACFLLEGYPVLSDDCLVVEEQQGRMMAIPAYPGLRLWDDAREMLDIDSERSLPVAHYTSKRRSAVESQLHTFPTNASPLKRLYALVWADEGNPGRSAAPCIEPLLCGAGFMELLQCAFLLDPTDQTMLTTQFHFLSDLTTHVPVKRLHRAKDFTALPAVRDLVLADLRER